MKVLNINGTSDLDCKCGSWLNHWKKFSNQECKWCSESYCRNAPDVGAHVQKSDPNDNNWYIIPLCHTHNKAERELEIMDSRVLVSANRAKTCDKTT